MKKFATALLIAALAAVTAQAQVTGGVADGYVTVTVDADTAMSGLDLKSAGGNFVPIPPGDTTADASPFTFLLANNASNVSYAAIPGTTVNVPAGTMTTGVGYTGDAAGAGVDMAASTYGNATFQQVSLPVESVPEPAAGLMAALACVGILGLRRRR